MPKASAFASSYPRVCVRIIGGVYHWLPVKAVAEPPSDAPRMGKVLEFLDPTPGWPEEWHELRCEALIARAHELCRLQRKSVSVVFGPRDAVYLESDGIRRQSDEPPWGGIGAGGGLNPERHEGEGVRVPPPTSAELREAMLDRHFPDRHEPHDEELEDDESSDEPVSPEREGYQIVCSGDHGIQVDFHPGFSDVSEACSLLRDLESIGEKKIDWPTLLEGLPEFEALPGLPFPPLYDLTQLEAVGPFLAELEDPIVDLPGQCFMQLYVYVADEYVESVNASFAALAERLRLFVEKELGDQGGRP